MEGWWLLFCVASRNLTVASACLSNYQAVPFFGKGKSVVCGFPCLNAPFSLMQPCCKQTVGSRKKQVWDLLSSVTHFLCHPVLNWDSWLFNMPVLPLGFWVAFICVPNVLLCTSFHSVFLACLHLSNQLSLGLSGSSSKNYYSSIITIISIFWKGNRPVASLPLPKSDSSLVLAVQSLWEYSFKSVIPSW